MVLFLVFGCASKAPISDQPGEINSGAVDFHISGKLAIRDGKKGRSVRFNWRQIENHYDIDVWGPLGQGRTQLFGDEHYLKITRGNQLLEAGLPHEVMYRQLGWAVPVSLLSAWIQGYPQPQLDVIGLQRDATGRIRQFSQLEWVVKLDKFESSQSNAKPRKITATQGDHKVIVRVLDTLQ
ncbi:MAG: outer membrane lipoprotein LolB [Gammaproteobacteria bacterium]|nr:outer membrane lipoprotein LolB [Gammaproteobacteria bacterium]